MQPQGPAALAPATAYRGVLPGLLLDRLALGLQDLKSGFWKGYNGDYVSYWWERQSRKPARYRCRLGCILLKAAAKYCRGQGRAT